MFRGLENKLGFINPKEKGVAGLLWLSLKY